MYMTTCSQYMSAFYLLKYDTPKFFCCYSNKLLLALVAKEKLC